MHLLFLGQKSLKKPYGIANIKKYTNPKSSIILLYYDAMASSERVSLEKTYNDVIKKSFFECQEYNNKMKVLKIE